MNDDETHSLFLFLLNQIYFGIVLFEKKNQLKKQASEELKYFLANNAFAQKYVDDFIKTVLENEIIPDILIETLKGIDVSRNFEYYRQSNPSIQLPPRYIN